MQSLVRQPRLSSTLHWARPHIIPLARAPLLLPNLPRVPSSAASDDGPDACRIAHNGPSSEAFVSAILHS